MSSVRFAESSGRWYGIAFELQKAQILGLIGPNGAGKTTPLICPSRPLNASVRDFLYDGQFSWSKTGGNQMPAVLASAGHCRSGAVFQPA